MQQIKKELGVAKIYSVHSSWFNNKVQVDLVIYRDDGIINLCEIKFCNSPFTINKPVYNNLKNNLLQFKKSAKTRKNVFITMITTFGVSENANSLELLTNSLTINSLFE